MENKPYQGESLGIVFRCKDPQGRPVDLTGAVVEVFLIDEYDSVKKSWTTKDGSLVIRGNVVAGGFSKKETAQLRGMYRMEVKVTIEGAVLMDTVCGIRIWGTLTGTML